MKNNILKFRNSDLNYFKSGKGKALVLVHGFTESSAIYMDFEKNLSEEFLLIIPDLPGHGKSQLPQNLDMDLMGDYINQILEAENIKECVIVGHSMGGYAALNFAEKYPEKCKSLCLFHSSARADSFEIKENRNRTIDIIKNNKTGFLNNFIPSLFAENRKEELKLQIEESQKIASTITQESLIANMQAMRDREGSLEFLYTTKIPIGFIFGKQDSRIQFDNALAQTALPKTSKVLILDDCGHMGYIEKPKEVLEFIKYFAK